MPDDKSKQNVQKTEAAGAEGGAGSVTVSGGGEGGAAFDPLKTPKMLNYLEKLSQEGYAVFLGDGDEGAATKAKAAAGASEEGPLSLKARVAQAVGLRPAAAAGPAQATDAAPGGERGGKPKGKPKGKGNGKKKGKKKGDAKGALGSGGEPSDEPSSKAGGKDALDYSRFDGHGDSEDEDEGEDGVGASGVPPEDYPEELQGGKTASSPPFPHLRMNKTLKWEKKPQVPVLAVPRVRLST